MQQQREAQRSQLRLPSAATTATAAAATAAAGGSWSSLSASNEKSGVSGHGRHCSCASIVATSSMRARCRCSKYALDCSLIDRRKCSDAAPLSRRRRRARHTALRAARAAAAASPIAPLLAEYERTCEVVNSRLAERVMSNYNLFVQGMSKIHELGLDLHQSAVICKNGRRLVQQTKGALTTHGIIVTAKHRKRQLYASVAADLRELQNIVANERRLREALEEGDFVTSIELALTGRELLRAYEQFTCLASFSSYVQTSWELLQRRLENSVRDVVRQFDALAYERTLIGHRRMGKVRTVD